MVKDLLKSSTAATSKSTSILFKILVIAAVAVDWDALRTAWNAVTNGVLATAVPLSGTYTASDWKTIECGAGTVIPAIAPGESPYDGKATINGVAEGVDGTILDWAYNMQGEEVVAVVERCSDGKKFIFASPCSGGMTFQYQSIGAQDGGKAGVAFTLTGFDCPKPMFVYEPASASA